MSLSQEDPAQRKNVQNWAQLKISTYNEELNNLIDDHDFSRIDSHDQSKQHDGGSLQEHDLYEERLSQADRQFGRVTLPSGSRKVIKVVDSDNHYTTQEIDSDKLDYLHQSDNNFSNHDANRSLYKAQHKSQQQESNHSSSHDMNDEQNVVAHKEDTYDEDFEDVASSEENITQKNTKFDLTTEFSIACLDYSKIRNDLSDYSLLLLKNTATTEGINKNGVLDKKACALLHTLKKMISDPSCFKSQPKFTRKQIVSYLISNDVFCYSHITIDTNSKVFELFPNTLIRLLYCSAKASEANDANNKSGKQVIQYTVALINAVASTKAGRDYLLPNDGHLDHGDHMTKLLIKRLVQILNKETDDSLIRQYAVGVLHKFSLRNTAQTQLIDNEVIDKIINIIRAEYQKLSDYSLECSMAMLMNLSLRTAGKHKMEQIYQIVVPLLKGILLNSSGQIIIYCVGILFSIISNRTIRCFVRQTNLIDYLSKTRDKLRNNLFTSIENDEEDEDITEDDKRQLLVQITYIIQKLEDKDNPYKIQEAEESRIGFTNSEEQDSLPEEVNDLSRPGTAQRGLQEDDNGDITDDEGLDTTLQDSGILFGNALLIAEYSSPNIKDGTQRHTKALPLEETKATPHEETKCRPREETKSALHDQSKTIITPPRVKENAVFDYKRPSYKHERDSDVVNNSSMPIRASQQLVMKTRLELESHQLSKEGNSDVLANRYSRHYQSVNEPVGAANDKDYNLVFKLRSKLIRTPQADEDDAKSKYEQETFGNKNSRPSLTDNYDDVRMSDKVRSVGPEIMTEVKRSTRKRVEEEKSAKKLSTSLKY